MRKIGLFLKLVLLSTSSYNKSLYLINTTFEFINENSLNVLSILLPIKKWEVGLIQRE